MAEETSPEKLPLHVSQQYNKWDYDTVFGDSREHSGRFAASTAIGEVHVASGTVMSRLQ